MASRKREDFYHYTDPASRQQIENSGKIQQSNDGLAGPGTYLTKMPPTERKGTIAENNYDGYQTAENRYQQGIYSFACLNYALNKLLLVIRIHGLCLNFVLNSK